MNVVAFDLSLTSTGWANAERSGVLVPPDPANRGTARLRWIRDAVIERVAPADIVVLEGYAFGRPNQAHQLGELGGVVRVALADLAIPFVDVPPACLKLFATGKGNANKNAVLAAAIRRLDYAGDDDNEADALWLLALARAHYDDDADARLSETKRRALAGVEWP